MAWRSGENFTRAAKATPNKYPITKEAIKLVKKYVQIVNNAYWTSTVLSSFNLLKVEKRIKEIASSRMDELSTIECNTGSTLRPENIASVDTGSVALIRDPNAKHSIRLREGDIAICPSQYRRAPVATVLTMVPTFAYIMIA